MSMDEFPVAREGDTLDLSLQPRPEVKPVSPADIREWLEGDDIELIYLGTKRDEAIMPTTWGLHHAMPKP